MKLNNPCVFLSRSAASKGVATVVNHGNPRINAMTAKMRGPFHTGTAMIVNVTGNCNRVDNIGKNMI